MVDSSQRSNSNTGDKVKNWLKNKDNLLLLGIILFSIFVRLYFLNLTNNQPVWWDEGEYLLKAKNIALGTPDTGFWPGRPILFPAFLSLFYFLGLGESAIRFFLALSSVVLVYLVYYVGEKLFDRRVGLISAFLFSLTYINLFYTSRVMVDILSMSLSLLGFAFLLSKKNKLIWLAIPLMAISTLMRFPAFILFIIFGIYIILTEGLSVFKNKNYWISAIIAGIISIIYLGWSYIKYGSPFYSILYAGSGSVEGITFSSGLSTLFGYISTFKLYFGLIMILFFVIGIILLGEVFFGYELLFRRKNKPLINKALLIIWIVIPLIYFSFWVSHYEDRYIFMIFPPVFYAMSLAIVRISSLVSRDNKKIALAFIAIVVLLGGYQMLSTSNSIIKNKLTSFDSIQEAGLWLKGQAPQDSIVMARSVPELTYYSELRTQTIPVDESDFVANFSLLRPQYILISLYDAPPIEKWGWAFNINASKYGLELVNAFPSNNPTSVLYKTQFTKN